MSMNRPTQVRQHQDAKVHPSTAGGPARRSTVNNSMTPNRRRSVENDEYASFIRRVLRPHPVPETPLPVPPDPRHPAHASSAGATPPPRVPAPSPEPGSPS
jgi:hypothetical protein